MLRKYQIADEKLLVLKQMVTGTLNDDNQTNQIVNEWNEMKRNESN